LLLRLTWLAWLTWLCLCLCLLHLLLTLLVYSALLHLNIFRGTHVMFGGLNDDLLSVEFLQLIDSHTTLLGFGLQHLLDLLRSEGVRGAGGGHGWLW
jgi:hypothetical protein